MIKIGLADDQALVRAGFAMVLNSQDDMSVVWDVADGRAAVAAALQTPVDVILMDIQMPLLNGIEATTEIVNSGASARVIGLTTFDNDDYVLGALHAGASGFLLKDAPPEDLLEAVRTVARGESVLAPRSTARLLRHIRPRLSQEDTHCILPHTAQSTTASRLDDAQDFGLVDPLTTKELEVTHLVALGYTNAQIAEKLFISMSTVKTHISRILAKTGSPDRVHIVLFAFKHGIVRPDEILSHTGV